MRGYRRDHWARLGVKGVNLEQEPVVGVVPRPASQSEVDTTIKKNSATNASYKTAKGNRSHIFRQFFPRPSSKVSTRTL